MAAKLTARVKREVPAKWARPDRSQNIVRVASGRPAVDQPIGRAGRPFDIAVLGAGKRLETSGAIEHYSAVINPAALGLRDIVFVEITLEKHDDKVLERFGKALTRIPEVIEASLVTANMIIWSRSPSPTPRTMNASCASASTRSKASGTRVRHSP